MKGIIIAILFSMLIVGGAVFFSQKGDDSQLLVSDGSNVSIVDGKQVIEIGARGGYSPQKNVAKAGIPTIIRFETKATFDCSAIVSIPSLDIRETLPQTGMTDVDLGIPKVGILEGNCGMGMYPFVIEFK